LSRIDQQCSGPQMRPTDIDELTKILAGEGFAVTPYEETL
jgi:hypothetical protein